ncbi:MAG TPA: hypothetical protein VEY51_05380, partial [Chondromyces sp.]|nr:hypothetical protein [Chondromyces sp.]
MQPNLSILRRNSLLAYLRFSIKRKSKYIREYKQLKELASILETKSISTYFQPVVELKSGKNIGYEVFN